MHGYDSGSFTSDECGGSSGPCPAFDRLFGSRIAVANLELRLPLLGALGVIPSPQVPPHSGGPEPASDLVGPGEQAATPTTTSHRAGCPTMPCTLS